MPRPKKAGAPEPKTRSRNGCWPCKARKVKCDELRPTCQNCLRQGETCDYKMRLNWEGRGRKKADSTGGIINFSTGTIPTPSKQHTAEYASKQIPQMEPHSGRELSAGQEIPMVQSRPDPIFAHQEPVNYSHETEPTSAVSHHDDHSMIDPSLTNSSIRSPIFPHGYAAGRHAQQHTQSYERFRLSTPGAPVSAYPSVAPEMRQDDGICSPGSFTQSPTTSIRSNHSAAPNDGQVSTPEFLASDSQPQGHFSYERPLKRVRIYTQDHSSMPPPQLHTSYTPGSFIPIVTGAPLTPALSTSDDGGPYTARLSPLPQLESPDLRRLSVNSLLSGPAGISKAVDANNELRTWSSQSSDSYQDARIYGVDRGFQDLDIGKNDDINAISGSSPKSSRANLDVVSDSDAVPFEFGFGAETSNSTFESGGSYYDKPVEIHIPRNFEPLPRRLLDNPMNLLYFHHFLNHTAGCLIPHNCSSNPFKSILPQMAVRDDNLLCLLLAYSASHRARHLRQPEPSIRIADWVQNIFPALRHALNDPSAIISNANLATQILLASLEIISPKAFGVEVPWQNHLDTARQMIAARGGPQRMQTASRGDHVSSFLWSWFAYLDVLGSLSGGKANSSSSVWNQDFDSEGENDYSIDCILGFTSRCVHILAKIAELARICDSSRIGPDHEIRSEWQPSEDVISRALKLETSLAASRLHSATPCTHMQSTGEAAYHWDNLEMAATNEAFHWAGLVHLHRRVLGKPSSHPEVQKAVREIFGALFKIRRGSSAEACLLFPMFTAGCDTEDEKQRAEILARITTVERLGMTQVHKARTLMERVWETGKPWETLVAGEFFG